MNDMRADSIGTTSLRRHVAPLRVREQYPSYGNLSDRGSFVASSDRDKAVCSRRAKATLRSANAEGAALTRSGGPARPERLSTYSTSRLMGLTRTYAKKWRRSRPSGVVRPRGPDGDGDGTLVTLTHREVTEMEVEGHRAGWHTRPANLAAKRARKETGG